MTVILNDPSWWPTIDWRLSYSYFVVASSAMVVYDWALTIGQEVDLLWSHRWSHMTFLYLGVRYIGILYSVNVILMFFPVVSLTDMVSTILFHTQSWGSFVVNFMLCVIMVVRLHAMHQRSKKMLIFLIATCLAVTITCGVLIAIISSHVSEETFILSGTYWCRYEYDAFLTSVTWILGTAWEILALCLAAWIAVKHFRQLPRRQAGSAIGDCLTVLIISHVFYFAGFLVVACFTLVYILSPVSGNSSIFGGFLQILSFGQMFVLGPRLILSVREYHAGLIADSDSGTAMSRIAFQAGIPVSTASGGDV